MQSTSTARRSSQNSNTPILTPPLKWAGGKRWLIPKLEKLYHSHRDRRLVEPFVGGLAVALGLNPERALLADANKHLICFYQWLRKGLIPSIEMKNDRAKFLAARARFNHLTQDGAWNSKEAAELFYYLNRTGFNGLCRFNNSGEFNVPFGKYSKISYTIDFSAYRSTLRQWSFVCSDFEKLKIKRDDLIYVDPPYDVQFTKYSRLDFKWDDQLRLVKWLSKHKGPIVASNQATPRILKLYRAAGFKVTQLKAPRMISCNGDRSPAMEMLATKNL